MPVDQHKEQPVGDQSQNAAAESLLGHSREPRDVADAQISDNDLLHYNDIHPLSSPRELDKLLEFIPADSTPLTLTLKYIIPAEEAYMRVYRIELPEINVKCLPAAKKINMGPNELLYSGWNIVGYECQQQLYEIDSCGFGYQYTHISGIEPPCGWDEPEKKDEFAFQASKIRYAAKREAINVRDGNQVWKFVPAKFTDINTAWSEQFISEKHEPALIDQDRSGTLTMCDIKCIFGKYFFFSVGYTSKGTTVWGTGDAQQSMGAFILTVMITPAIVKVTNWLEFIRDKSYDRLFNNYPVLERRYFLGMLDNIHPSRYTFGYERNLSFRNCCLCSLNQKTCSCYCAHPISCTPGTPIGSRCDM